MWRLRYLALFWKPLELISVLLPLFNLILSDREEIKNDDNLSRNAKESHQRLNK